MTSATGNRGFTLLELLVVLTILVLLAGAWPFAAARLFPTQQLRNETHRLTASLRTLRTMARATGAPRWIDIAAPPSAYVSGTDARELPKGMLVHLRGPLSATRLTFFPDGSSTGGVFELTLLSRSEHVTVGTLTGRTEISE